MRKFWRNIHLWLGLTAGTLLVLIGLTGSALVFYRYLEEQIYPDMLLVEASDSQTIGLAEALRLAERLYPDGTVLGVMPPRHERATYIAYRYYERGEGDYSFTFLSIHPYSGAFLGEREFGKSVMTFIYKLHYTLTMGTTGAFIVGFIGIFLLVSLFTGLYLWWPKAGKWRQALWFKTNASTHRRNFDIHRVFGFYPAVILIAVAFSGVYMIFPDQVRWGVSVLMYTSEEDEFHFAEPLQSTAPALEYEKVIEIASTVFPGARIRDFDRPHDASHPYTVAFDDPDQPMTSYGYNRVSIHPHTGEILEVRRWNTAPAGNAFLAWQFPLHNGEVFGLFGRWVIFVSGFLPAVLYTTGLRMWLKRRKPATKKQSNNIPLSAVQAKLQNL